SSGWTASTCRLRCPWWLLAPGASGLRPLIVQPGHAGTQLGAHFLDRVIEVLLDELVVGRLALLVLLDPVLGELALLDVLEDLAHLLLGLRVHDARTADEIAPLGRLRDELV